LITFFAHGHLDLILRQCSDRPPANPPEGFDPPVRRTSARAVRAATRTTSIPLPGVLLGWNQRRGSARRPAGAAIRHTPTPAAHVAASACVRQVRWRRFADARRAYEDAFPLQPAGKPASGSPIGKLRSLPPLGWRDNLSSLVALTPPNRLIESWNRGGLSPERRRATGRFRRSGAWRRSISRKSAPRCAGKREPANRAVVV
jgi:hypothetical protein